MDGDAEPEDDIELATRLPGSPCFRGRLSQRDLWVLVEGVVMAKAWPLRRGAPSSELLERHRGIDQR